MLTALLTLPWLLTSMLPADVAPEPDDDSTIWPYVLLALVAVLIVVIAGLFLLRRRRP